MPQSHGLRISLIGAVVFAISMASLLLLPHIVGIVGMSMGGVGVWSGFLVTLFSFYGPPQPPSDSR